MSYYKDQLNKLEHSNDYLKTLKVFDSEGNETKHLSLNIESIEQISEWLYEERDRLNELSCEKYNQEVMASVLGFVRACTIMNKTAWFSSMLSLSFNPEDVDRAVNRLVYVGRIETTSIGDDTKITEVRT